MIESPETLNGEAGRGFGAAQLLAALASRRENLISEKPKYVNSHALWIRLDAQIAELERTEKLVRDMAANSY